MLTRKNRKLFPLCVSFFAFVLLIGLTAIPSHAAARKFEGVKLVAMIYPPERISPALIKEFEDQTGAKIELQKESWEGSRAKFLTDFTGGGSSYDIVFLDTPWVAEYGEVGLLEPLEKYIDASFNLNDFPKQLLDTCSWKGKLYVFPYNPGVVSFWYNKKLFNDSKYKSEFQKKYGYPLGPPKNYSQMYQLAEFFTRDTSGGGKIDLWGTSHSNKKGGFIQNDVQPYVYSWGVNWVDEKTGKANFTDPKLREAVAYYVSLRKFQPPGADNFTSGESVAQFTNGRVAFVHEYGAYLQQILDPSLSKIAAENNVGWAVKPSGVRQGSGINGNYIGVYSRSKNKQATFEFIKHLLMPDSMIRSAIDMYIPPGRLSVLQNKTLLSKVPALETTLPILKDGYYTDPKTVKYAELREIFGEALSLVFTGQMELNKAFDRAQELADKATK